MGFLKALFGGKEESPEEKQQADEARNFDMFKFDGVKAAKMGQWEYAIKCYKEALKLKEDLEIRDYLATALMHNNELLPAYEQLQKLSEAQPDNAAIWKQMAQVAYMMEDYGAMSSACEKAMLLMPEDANIHYLYAEACLGQEDLVNAIAMLTKTITLDPKLADAYLLRGKTLLKMGDINGASEDSEQLIADYPDQEDVLLFHARVLTAQGKKKEAVTEYGRVIDVNPFCIEAFKERGQLYYDLGDTKNAEDDVQKVLELNPDQLKDVSGDYSAEGIEQKVKSAYSNINPMGL
jgi:tetratricopeptide (TPR) repeat protein